jgi:hypothetical protein
MSWQMKHDHTIRLMDLHAVKGRRFTDEEKDFIRKHVPKSKFKARYCLWKQERRNGLYILFIIDHFPNKVRPTAMDRAIEVVVSRDLTEHEYNECIENYGCVNRIYETYHYRDVEWLIHEDQLVGAKTPEIFINECRKRGFTKQPDLFGSNYEYLKPDNSNDQELVFLTS